MKSYCSVSDDEKGLEIVVTVAQLCERTSCYWMIHLKRLTWHILCTYVLQCNNNGKLGSRKQVIKRQETKGIHKKMTKCQDESDSSLTRKRGAPQAAASERRWTWSVSPVGSVELPSAWGSARSIREPHSCSLHIISYLHQLQAKFFSQNITLTDFFVQHYFTNHGRQKGPVLIHTQLTHLLRQSN